MKKGWMVFLLALMMPNAYAQPDRWQQRVKYVMDIDMNVQTNRFTGRQKLEYWNNSPDTLTRLFYHLYFNAFQPGSMMDERSRRQGGVTVPGRGADWDSRVRDRIAKLKPEEIGYQKVVSLKMNGRPQNLVTDETILEVKLDKPVLPRSKVLLEMEFEAQVPLQIRRSGRDNPQSGVRYSMTQWYPKICEYDNEGWHPTPYVGREFYGVWGDFEVNISIDKKYILGGTGYLQNPAQIGYGYENPGTKIVRPAGDKLTWKFSAPNVHDFAWVADPDFVHLSRKVRDSLTIHVLYKKGSPDAAEWEGLLDYAGKVLPYMEKTFGAYAYRQFSFLHGGDGGMEYPMATLCIGPGAALHEWLHNWYYGMLATNESLYPWMDEGFTQYAEERVSAWYNNRSGCAQADNYNGYYSLVKSGKEEPLSTHADHYNTNFAYSLASYTKGAVFLEQLGYIMGAGQRDRLLLAYYQQWKFRHPRLDDFIRLAEKISDMKLDWYKQYWVYSTKTIDYSIDSLWEEAGLTRIRLRRQGLMPMPVDLQIRFRDGSQEWHYVPLNLMYGSKPAEDSFSRTTYPAWKWTHPTYVVETRRRLSEISAVEIDPSLRLADVERKNNRLELKW